MKPLDWKAEETALFERALGAFLAGRPYLDDLRESNRRALERMRATGAVERVEILGCSDSCQACLTAARWSTTIAEALELTLLPVLGCTHPLGEYEGWCRCLYVAIAAP
jgi:hypothetical protein